MESLDKPAQIIPRGWIGTNVAIQIAAVVFLVLAANYFSFNHYARWDLSRSQKFVLSEQTKAVFRELKKPVKVTVFFSPTVLTPESMLYADVVNLLKEFVFSGRKMIEVEYVDPTRDLSRARVLQSKYKFGGGENVVILDYDGRTKLLAAASMADFDTSQVPGGGEARLLAFKGEQALTNGLIALLSPDTRKVYFLQGHGEPPVGPGSPLTTLSDYIARQNLTIDTLSLASKDSIPADCAVLVIVAPQLDLNQREAGILAAYWEAEGRLLVLLDPAASTPALGLFLSNAGLVPLDDRVLRLVRLPFAMGILRDVTAEFLGRNAITKRLEGTSLLLPGATQSIGLDVELAQRAGIQIRPLLQAAEEFWGETDHVTDANTGVKYEHGKDHGQPVYVAAAADRGGVSDDRVEVASSKLVAVGSAQFALDAAMTPQGLDFLLSAVNWLADRGQLTGVMPKSVKHFSLHLTDAQLGTLSLYTMIVIPGIAALLGVITWIRRRS